MTKRNSSVIVKQERKADRCVQGKEGTQMNTTMILSYLKRERYEAALDSKQGLVSVHTFLRERNYTTQRKSEKYEGLC